MAIKNVVCTDLAMAYSSRDWNYTTDGTSYAGFAGGTLYGVTILRFAVPAFSGLSEALQVAMVMTVGMLDAWGNVTLRWALCSSDANRNRYKSTTAEVEDEYQVDSGTFQIEDVKNVIETRSFTLPTKNLKGGTWYLFLWASGNSGISLREVSGAWGKHSVSLDYKSGGVRIQTPDGAKLFGVFNGERKRLTPYVMTASGIKPIS